ncbi:MAG: PEP-CTERM sorting domain-containing protein [Snowella sp.]
MNYLGSGTFIATAVPEPLTTLGSLMAIGFGVAFKRKSRGQRSSD